MIVLQPVAGLCNRIWAIGSAIALSRSLGKKLVVFWEANKGINCSFSDIFIPPKSFTLVNINLNDNLKFVLNTNTLYTIRQRSNLAKKVIEYMFRKKFDVVIWPEQFVDLKANKFDFLTLNSYEKIFISSHSPFFWNDKLISEFAVTENIKRKIDRISSKFNSDTIGVHIRRTDHKAAMAQSPTERFIEFMKKEIELCEKTNFFLATDCPKTEKIMHQAFKNRVLVQEKEFSRRSLNGMKDAVVDLYCLSKTKKLLGSYHSSFSYIAAEISGIERITVML